MKQIIVCALIAASLSITCMEKQKKIEHTSPTPTEPTAKIMRTKKCDDLVKLEKESREKKIGRKKMIIFATEKMLTDITYTL